MFLEVPESTSQEQALIITVCEKGAKSENVPYVLQFKAE